MLLSSNKQTVAANIDTDSVMTTIHIKKFKMSTDDQIKEESTRAWYRRFRSAPVFAVSWPNIIPERSERPIQYFSWQ